VTLNGLRGCYFLKDYFSTNEHTLFANERFNGQKLMEDAIFFCWSSLKHLEEGFDIPFHSSANNIRVGFCNQGDLSYRFLMEGCLY